METEVDTQGGLMTEVFFFSLMGTKTEQLKTPRATANFPSPQRTVEVPKSWSVP